MHDSVLRGSMSVILLYIYYIYHRIIRTESYYRKFHDRGADLAITLNIPTRAPATSEAS